jgi:hypothetical protein
MKLSDNSVNLHKNAKIYLMRKPLLIIILGALGIFSSQAVQANINRIVFPGGSANVDNSGGIHRYLYTGSALNVDTNVEMFYDQVLDQYVLLANLFTQNLRVVFLDKNFNVVREIDFPEKTDSLPYNLHSINFYPTQITAANKILPGKLLLETLRGNLVVDMGTREANFIFFSKNLLDRKSNSTPVVEIKK